MAKLDLLIIIEEAVGEETTKNNNLGYEEKEPIIAQTVTTPFKYVRNMLD